MRKILLNWWFLSLLTALIAAVILMLLIPLLLPSWGSFSGRLISGIVIALAWALAFGWRFYRAQAAAGRLRSAVSSQDSESKLLSGKIAEALTKMKSARGAGRNYLYDRPWFVVIGPPGTGKTTALANSGLKFPVAPDNRAQAGTRNIDFFFAEEAILIDTAGRYTTQDSDNERDLKAWTGFLAALSRNRPLQPINGVLVTLALDTLASASADEIDRHADIVRHRLDELQQHLQITFPVYVLLTKADLVAGFKEFFDDLDAEGRRAVLGATFPWHPDQKPAVQAIGESFDTVCRSVETRTSKRLQEEQDILRRSVIVGFPGQILSLREPFLRFLGKAFPSDADMPSLRGFYFTSGIQVGSPFDRILGSAATSVRPADARPAAGRAYFINRLLSEILFREAGLVRQLPQMRRRRQLALYGGMAAIAGIGVLTTGIWLASFVGNRELLNDLAAQTPAIKQQIANAHINLTTVATTDPRLDEAAPILDSLRNLPGGYATRHDTAIPLSLRFGLFQEGASRAAELTYLNVTQRIVLPRLLLRFEDRLRKPGNDTLSQYDALKTYLMLGGQAPKLEAAALNASVTHDWASDVYPGRDLEPVRDRLAKHVSAMLDDPQFGHAWEGNLAPLDGALVQTARLSVGAFPPAERAYAILKQKLSQGTASDWRADRILSTSALKAFAAPNQVQALTVPYLYTREGFDRYRLELPTIQADLERDLWVLGEDQSKQSTVSSVAQIREGVAALYARDYIAAWEQVAEALKPANVFNDLDSYRALATDPSPLKLMLLQISRNTTLSADPASKAAQTLQAKLPAAVTSAVQGSASADAATAIEQHFQPLRAYVGDGTKLAPLDTFIAKLRTAAGASLAARQAATPELASAQRTQLTTAMSELQQLGVLVPQQLRSYASVSAAQAGAAQTATAETQVAGTYGATVGPACVAAAVDKYPFAPSSRPDASLNDMAQVFGASGSLSSFIDSVNPYLVRTTSAWTWRKDQSSAANLNPDAPQQFQKAASIRDLLTLGVALNIELVSVSGKATGADITVGNSTVSFAAPNTGAKLLRWMPQNQDAKLVLTADKAALKEFSAAGPWALLRLMDQSGGGTPGALERTVTLSDGTNSATFRVSSAAATAALQSGNGIWSFRCPNAL
ncbi:MAG TPA: type VI secretion system membrane subunit TssM [Micropepsaceae bacterium]|nr:type VI secretion system membrane subunit TssM [Micropepsaceae bacterium]